MKPGWLCRGALTLFLGAAVAEGQEANGIQDLQDQLKQLQERFERQQRDLRASFERMIREQQAQIDALRKHSRP